MFAWDEESRTETKTNAGGSETKVTTYSYSTRWTSSPENSSSFKRGGHHNPQMAVKGETLRAKEAVVGAFGLEMADVDLPAFKSVTLDEANTRSGRVSGDYLYLNDRPSSPRVGDIRLSYDVVPSGQKVTLFGQLDAADHVTTYTHKSGDTLYRAVNGTKADAVETMHGEHVMMTWILRAVGFGMMWMGLAMVLEPINVFLDVLPFLGGLGRGLTGFGTFLVAALLSVVTVIVSIVFHNLFAMIAIGIATVAVGAVLFSKKGARTARRVVPQA
jgi:LysM repeat protein